MAVDLKKCDCSTVRLSEKRIRLGEIDIYYALCEINDGQSEKYTCAVVDSGEVRCAVFSDTEKAHEFYELISENEVDTASFDGILHDFLYVNNML